MSQSQRTRTPRNQPSAFQPPARPVLTAGQLSRQALANRAHGRTASAARAILNPVIPSTNAPSARSMATAYERYFGRGLIGSQRPRFLHKSAHAYSVHITKHYHAVDKRSPDAPGVMSGLLAEYCFTKALEIVSRAGETQALEAECGHSVWDFGHAAALEWIDVEAKATAFWAVNAEQLRGHNVDETTSVAPGHQAALWFCRRNSILPWSQLQHSTSLNVNLRDLKVRIVRHFAFWAYDLSIRNDDLAIPLAPTCIDFGLSLADWQQRPQYNIAEVQRTWMVQPQHARERYRLSYYRSLGQIPLSQDDIASLAEYAMYKFSDASPESVASSLEQRAPPSTTGDPALDLLSEADRAEHMKKFMASLKAPWGDGSTPQRTGTSLTGQEASAQTNAREALQQGPRAGNIRAGSAARRATSHAWTRPSLPMGSSGGTPQSAFHSNPLTQGPRNLTATAPIFTPAAPSTAASFNPAAPTSYIAPSQHSLPAAQYGYLEQHILYLRTQAQQFNSAILSQEAMQQDTRVARQQYNEILQFIYQLQTQQLRVTNQQQPAPLQPARHWVAHTQTPEGYIYYDNGRLVSTLDPGHWA